MSGINSGVPEWIKATGFGLGLQGLGALRSYPRAQGPLDMVESGKAVPRREQSLGQFN